MGVYAIGGAVSWFGCGQSNGESVRVRVRMSVDNGVGRGSGVCECEEVGCCCKGAAYGVVRNWGAIGQGTFKGGHVVKAFCSYVEGNGCGNVWDESASRDGRCGDEGCAIGCGCAEGAKAWPYDRCRG